MRTVKKKQVGSAARVANVWLEWVVIPPQRVESGEWRVEAADQKICIFALDEVEVWRLFAAALPAVVASWPRCKLQVACVARCKFRFRSRAAYACGGHKNYEKYFKRIALSHRRRCKQRWRCGTNETFIIC